jgi:tetratricopeptide (TPR) repeat protein
MFQTNQILVLNGYCNKFKTTIKYANQFSLISKHNFIYFIESTDYHFEFEYLAKQLDINITNNNNNNQQILNIDKIIKRIYNEINNRCLNNKRTKILFIFNKCNLLEDQLLDLIQLAPKNVYFLIISNLINKRFSSIELKEESLSEQTAISIEIIKDNWNLIKYYSIFYSSFIPIEIIEYLEIKLDTPATNQVIESVVINENIGFSIKQSIQSQIKDYLKDNDIQEIIDKLNSSITYLFSLVDIKNKFYYYNLKEIVNFILSCNKADNNQIKSKYALEMADYCLKCDFTNKSIQYYEISFQYSTNINALNNICKCGRSDRAILNYFKLDLNDENVLFNIGLAYFNLKKYSESLNYLFKKCLMCTQTLNLIGKCYQKQENLKIALEFYEKSINQSNNKEEKVQVLNNIGLCYIQMKLYLKSIDYLNESLDIEKTINCLKYLGLCHFKLEKYKQSLNYYEDAFKMNLNDELNKAECFYFIGKCYKSMGKFKKSIDFYKESIKINRLLFFDENIDIVTFLNVGNVYENLGKCTKAIEYYEKSLSFIYEY